MPVIKPFPYYGGKSNLIPDIVSRMPFTMSAYIEPFAGSASLFFAASGRWSSVEVLNDLNSDLINFLHVLRDKPKKLIDKLRLTPDSREEYNAAFCAIRDHVPGSHIDRALWFFVMTNQAFSAAHKINSWHTGKNETWINATKEEKLYLLSERLLNASLENYPADKVIKLYDKAGVFFYIDPPYIGAASQRDVKAAYHGRDLTVEDHAKFLELLCEVKGMIILSGYNHPVYDGLLKMGWVKVEIKTSTQVNNRRQNPNTKTKERIEILWINPACQASQRQGVLL